MDKPAKKAIIIKVNGKEQPYTTAMSALPQWSSEQNEEQSEEQHDFIEWDKQYKTKRSPWRSFALAIALAIVLGTSFGLFVLTIIPTTESKPASTATLQQELSSAQMTEEVFVVQGGAFQDDEAASEYVQKIEAQHRPSVTIGKSPVYVFLGMALTKEEAKQMASLYEPLGIDTYVKPWNVSIDEKEKEEFFTIVSFISKLLAGQQLVNEQWKQLQSYSFHNEHMKKAYKALFTFRQSNDQKQLWKAQQHILHVLQ